MKKYNFEVSETFERLIAEYGLNGISDLNIGEEATRQGIQYKRLESWEFEDGKLEIYVD